MKSAAVRELRGSLELLNTISNVVTKQGDRYCISNKDLKEILAFSNLSTPELKYNYTVIAFTSGLTGDLMTMTHFIFRLF